MKLFYSPGACALSPHIVLLEAGLPFTIEKTDLRTKKTETGSDYYAVNSKGTVPALQLDDGRVLTEGPAIVQYLADQNPSSGLAPKAGSIERYRLQEWLSFINSEVHKAFSPLFGDTSADTKQYARGYITKRLNWLQGAMGAKTFLMGEQYTVADPYLFTVLNWGRLVDLDIGQWPALKRFHERIGARPHTIEALKAEGLLK